MVQKMLWHCQYIMDKGTPKEIESADKVTEYYGVEHISLDLEKIFQYSDCSLLAHSDKEIPEESYGRTD